jgi:hypothetical protein
MLMQRLTINVIVAAIYGSGAIQQQDLFFGDAQTIVFVAPGMPGGGYGFLVGPFGGFWSIEGL